MEEKERFILECGRIKTKNNTNFKHIEYEIDENGCWNCVSHSCDSGGYPKVSYKNKMYKMNRFVYNFYYKDLNDGSCIMHSCDNPKCINPNHLKQGTHKDNMEDMVNKKRQPRGFKNGKSKLIESDVLNIVELYNKNINIKEIANIYNISVRCVKSIVNGERWAWFTEIKR